MNLSKMLFLALGCEMDTLTKQDNNPVVADEQPIHFIYSGNMRGDIEPCG